MIASRRALLALPNLIAPAAAQGASVRVVVPFPAGGGTDTIARLWAPAFAARLGQAVVIDNRPGAGGVPAADAVVRAAPDGLTLLLATSSIHSTGPALNPRLPYDVERDFVPLALLATSASLILVASSVPAQTVPEFVAWARARRGDVNYGSSGVGTIPHLNAALFDALGDCGMVHVPYRGTGQVYAEMRRGEVHLLIDGVSTAATHLTAGTVRAIAHTAPASAGPLPQLPDVPAAEATLPGMASETWFGLFGPGTLPAPLAARIATAAAAAVEEPAIRERLSGLGAEVRATDPAALARVAAEERARWTALVARLGIRAAD